MTSSCCTTMSFVVMVSVGVLMLQARPIQHGASASVNLDCSVICRVVLGRNKNASALCVAIGSLPRVSTLARHVVNANICHGTS